MKVLLRLAPIAVIAALLHPVTAAPSLPEYSATEAAKHIGETARLVGMVDCIEHGRRHTDVEIGGCLPHTLLWVVVPNDVSGPELDCEQLRGVTIAVTGKIESPGGIPQVVVKSTEQIVPRTSPNPNYLASANHKENTGDLYGAIADLDRAVELTHDPGTYIERAGLKEKKADFVGAIRDYDELIERSADTNAFTRAEYYQSRAKLKIKKSDLDGAIADADAAIRLYPRSPWHYATRGQANEAKGNFVAAVNDYQMAINTEPHNSIYKDMLKHAQAQAAGSRGGNSQPSDSPQSATALVTQAKAKLAAGDFDGAIADCDRVLQLSRGGSKEAFGLRIQAMRAKANPSTKSAHPVQLVSSPQPLVAVTISVTETSIKIGNIELRNGPSQGKYRYISLAAAEKALGPATEKYPAGRIVDYARPSIGVHLQEGIRGAEEGKIFKFQVYMEDDYDARSEKNSGKFNGHVQVEGVDIGPGTTFDSVRDELKKEGYKITKQPDLSYAQKSGPWGQIQIFTAGSSGKIGRVEVWCL